MLRKNWMGTQGWASVPHQTNPKLLRFARLDLGVLTPTATQRQHRTGYSRLLTLKLSKSILTTLERQTRVNTNQYSSIAHLPQ